MSYDCYKPLVIKSGYSNVPYRIGQNIAWVKAGIDYDTGEVVSFRVMYGPQHEIRYFKTFEEAMMFCDINDFYIEETEKWSDPHIGMSKFFLTIA